MKRILVTMALLCFGCSANAALVNDFDCALNEGYDLPKLLEFQQEWMQAARRQGFDESYKTRVLLPAYNDNTRTRPLNFTWRGEFRDGEQLGKMLDWFLTDPWAGKFQQVMECESASLWWAPQ